MQFGKRFITCLAFTMMPCFSGTLTVNAESVGARNSKEPSAQTIYECQKTDEKITVDGVLDEGVWRRTPAMPFVGIADGSKPPFLTEAKMLWDDKYLYVGYYFEEPDIRAYWGMEEANLTDDLLPASCRGPAEKKTVWNYSECTIMSIDRFAKLFLDPDGDGVNYLEFQCNPLNNYFDSWYKQGFTDGKWGNRERYPSVEWKCPGLLSATHVDGSVNSPQDVDRGWSLEIAIPWTSIAPFTKGACPPVSDDIWGVHLGRGFRDRIGGPNEYWVWPFLGVTNCHLPDRYGKLVFKDETRHFERLFAAGMPRVVNGLTIQRMAQMGVTDVWASPDDVKQYAAAGINVYPTVTLSPEGWEKVHPGVPPPLQKMTDAEIAVKAILSGTSTTHRSSARKEGEADEPQDWDVSDKQKNALATMGRANAMVQTHYQWGGEPELKHFGKGMNTEVLLYDILCPNTPGVKELMESRIKEALAIPGVKGVAFDGIGYQNYHACFCPVCEKMFNEFCEREKKDPKKAGVRDEFSLKCLVDLNNKMVDYVHALKADAITVNHIWPVFMPEPLYGNRLKMDFCGQTAAWYFYWDPWRIEKYSRTISCEQEKYWKGVKGVTLIGYYDNPAFPVKTPAKVESELRAILRGGSKYLMVCGLDDLLRNEDVCEVFKKFCSPQKTALKTAR